MPVVIADPLPVTAEDCPGGGDLEETGDATVVATAALDDGKLLTNHHEGSGLGGCMEATPMGGSYSAMQQCSNADFDVLPGVIGNNSTGHGNNNGCNERNTNADLIEAAQVITAALPPPPPPSAWLWLGAAAAAATAFWLCSLRCQGEDRADSSSEFAPASDAATEREV